MVSRTPAFLAAEGFRGEQWSARRIIGAPTVCLTHAVEIFGDFTGRRSTFQRTAARKPIHYLPRTFRNVRMIFPQRSGSLTPIDAPDARRTSGCSKRPDFSPAHPGAPRRALPRARPQRAIAQKGVAGMIPTARGFLTRPPTGRYFSPTLPSDCFAIDFP